MADLSQIKLPNSSVYDIKDALAVSSATFSGHQLTLIKRGNTMTNIDLGEFDALDVTELNAGNLIVTGAARFTNGMYGNLSGNADTATKLATARTIQTNLASTSSASFDGSANITPGITGTLGVGNGGTGQTSAINAANAFINSLTTGSSDPQDADYYISQYVGGGASTTTYHRRPHSALWNYIKSKINSVLGLNESTYSGTSAKATKANLTTTANAVAYYTDTAGTFGSKATASGALYAISANGALNFGTLPVGQGGTGNTTGTATYATTTEDTSSTLYPVGVTSDATTTLKRDKSITMSGGTITATTFSGNATSATSAGSATKATQDEDGNNIKATYANSISISGNVITLKNKNGAQLGNTVTVPWVAMVGATSSSNGSVGYVNAVPPSDGYNTKFLRADGTWAVPNDENTHNTAYLYAGTSSGTANAETTNGNTYLILVDGGSATTRRKIVGSGATSVASNSSGDITISSQNTWNAMTGATSSANGTVGYVNAIPPSDGYNTKFLRADGTWAVPNDENTHNTAYLYAGTSTGTGNAETGNGSTYLILVDGGSATTRRKIYGSGATTVASNSSGDITISSQNTWTAMTGATSSADGTVGYVNATPPKANYDTAYLRADGTWSVPPNDLNTHYATHIYAGTGTAANAVTTNGNTMLAVADDSTVNDTIKIVGSGLTSVASSVDENNKGIITITTTIANNVTGSGTSGYLAKFNGANTITNGPQLGSATNTFLRNDGSWVAPPNDDTHYTSLNVVNNSDQSITNTTSILSNGNVYLNSVENDDVTSSHKIYGQDATFVTTDANGNIVITSTNTTYDAATANPLMDGTTAVGTSAKYAREDHVHPHDSTKVDVVSGKGLSTEDYTTTEKNKLSGIAENAEVNQFAFSNVAVSTTTIAANAKTDTLTLTAGSNVTLTPDATNKKVTIAATNSNTIPSGYCTTAASTAAKTASFTYFSLKNPCYLQFVIRYSNTKAAALTMAVNSTAAKPIYIDGQPSSSTNYTLPAGSYFVYYDGTAYQFRTDAKIPGFIMSSYNCYTSSYTDNSELSLAGILKAQSSDSYKRVYHSPYVSMRPYELLVQDRSDTTGVSIGANATSSTTANDVTTYTDGGLITINNNVHTSSVSTVTTNPSILLNGLDSTITIYRPQRNQQTILLNGDLGSGNPSITLSTPASDSYSNFLNYYSLKTTKNGSGNVLIKLFVDNWMMEEDGEPFTFDYRYFGKLELGFERQVGGSNVSTTTTTGTKITLNGYSGMITSESLTVSSDLLFTQSAIDALYPTTASSSIDIPASLIATVNSRLDAQDAINSATYTAVGNLADIIGTVPANTTVQGQINTISSNYTTLSNTVSTHISTMSSNTAVHTFASVAYQATTTNYEYVGAYVTVPSGYVYLCWFQAGYSTGAPSGIAICNSNNTCNASTIIYEQIPQSPLWGRSTPAYFLTAGTYYLWAKRATVPSGTNPHNIWGIILHQP